MQTSQVKRDRFQTRTIRLVGKQQLDTALALITRLPIDSAKPLEIVIREEVKPRKPDQNALYWVGPLSDIAAQAYIDGRTLPAEVWHETYKRLYLPEEFDAELTKEGYRKWAYDRDGQRVLIGSTTQLTVKGFARYLEQVIADGASMGVEFNMRATA